MHYLTLSARRRIARRAQRVTPAWRSGKPRAARLPAGAAAAALPLEWTPALILAATWSRPPWSHWVHARTRHRLAVVASGSLPTSASPPAQLPPGLPASFPISTSAFQRRSLYSFLSLGFPELTCPPGRGTVSHMPPKPCSLVPCLGKATSRCSS